MSRMDRLNVSAIPYLKNVPARPREVVLANFFEARSGKWIAYTPEGPTEAIALNFHDLTAGDYLAVAPQREDDTVLPLVEALYQHFSFPGTLRLSDAIEDDFMNGLSALQSYFVFLVHQRRVGGTATVPSICALVEYALINHRSCYDLLNDVVIAVLAHTDAKKSTIPSSFRRVALKSDEELKSKHGFTDQLVAFYKNAERRFMTLRAVRDRIAHGGRSPGLVFCYDDGFGLFLKHGLFQGLELENIWPSGKRRTEHIGSALSLLAFLSRDLHRAMDATMDALMQSFAVLPPPVAPDHRLYVRNDLLRYFRSLDRYEATPWLAPDPELT